LKLNYRLIQMDPERQETYVERLGREIDRLNGLIEDLLRLSRLDQGRVTLNMERLDLNELGRQYVEDRSPLAEDRRIGLAFKGRARLPEVQADKGLLGQAISVLLTNALNYTPGGGQVAVVTRTRRRDGQAWAGIAVSDTGPGIGADEIKQLFQRFFRGRTGRDSGVPGTGLGLAIAHEIVERHRGQIEVESAGVPGEGTRFTIWLPAAAENDVQS
jgi:signal transduction histidine kinase